MNRRNFLKSATAAAVGVPTIGMCLTNKEQVKEPVFASFDDKRRKELSKHIKALHLLQIRNEEEK